jgi:hypothetical protein
MPRGTYPINGTKGTNLALVSGARNNGTGSPKAGSRCHLVAYHYLQKYIFLGNSFWETPMDMLFYVLSQDPRYSDVEEFMGDVDSLLTILTSRPELENARLLVNQLWMGEMTWREFVEDFMHIYLQQVKEARSNTSERKGNVGQPEFCLSC